MPTEFLVVAGLALAAVAMAIVSIVYVVAGLSTQRGELRSRRLRRSLSSFLLSIALAATVAALYSSVLLVHPTMRVLHPQFNIPYQSLTYGLSIVTLLAAIGAATPLIRRVRQGSGKWPIVATVGSFLLFLIAASANYALTYSVQVPAFQRYTLIESGDWRTRVGEPAPDFTVSLLDGTTINSSALRGKVVLLNFFATWCGPCMLEIPHLQDTWDQFRDDDDFQMLVVDREESKETVEAFLARSGFSIPIALDPQAAAFHQFAEKGIPRTYVISRDGKILFQTLGFSDSDLYKRELATLRSVIERELNTDR